MARSGNFAAGWSGKRRKRGFEKAASLVDEQVRVAGETRGFAVSRVVTHWGEIVGAELAAVTRPVSVHYGRKGGLGATLTVLTVGARAPMLQMQEPALREKINACYGYNAISRIKFTQTAATGFAEGRADFDHASAPRTRPEPPPQLRAKAAEATVGIGDPGLRAALESLGAQILTKSAT